MNLTEFIKKAYGETSDTKKKELMEELKIFFDPSDDRYWRLVCMLRLDEEYAKKHIQSIVDDMKPVTGHYSVG